MVVSEYQPSSLKYFYKGTTLRQYCIQNNISYYSVVSYIKRKQAKGSPKSIDELIDEGIKTINRYGIIYYYKGIPLKDYTKKIKKYKTPSRNNRRMRSNVSKIFY